MKINNEAVFNENATKQPSEFSHFRISIVAKVEHIRKEPKAIMTHSYDVSNEVRKAPVNRYADAFYPFRQSSAIARSSPTMQIKSATHAKHAQLVMKITG